ncbi:1-deoxy-D-xylulose-5-phosphate synthase [Actinomadura hibisca]|uniref:1-deoxy-D-xylulose-5-phosphate synthase n=1 Tax=Actinomadura hibisca TaxID=68565 RepID=UPI0009FE1876|nr:1-deoxy-D-xylulose-5-phosphate synthase [Actinomadura hibisca]
MILRRPSAAPANGAGRTATATRSGPPPLESLDPRRLRALPAAELPLLAERIRRFLVARVCATGGHLGPNLGVVELTMALHRVFDSPRDALLFDTGHQSYVHKILTGRAGGFGMLRQQGGLSGYPSRTESEHDWVENSHASTALAYADGLAKALRLTGAAADRTVLAVVGDGALTGGAAWEGLNNIGAAPDRPVIVVLNDNGRSYAPTTGGLAAHLADLRERLGRPGVASPPTVFEQCGLAYLGPVDGHDIGALEDALRQARDLRRPVVVHVLTRKGRGYEPAERDRADHLHGVGVLDPATGRPIVPGAPSWTSVFGREMARIGARRPALVAVTAAMLLPVGLGPFAEAFPDRVYDVGIAEQHAVGSAAGLAMGGLHPVVCLYGTFLNRAVDQLLMDVALHRLPVTFVLDRAGITGPDGPSHHGAWDMALLGAVPGLRMAAPRDPVRLCELLDEAIADDTGPTAIRFPKATASVEVPALARVEDVDVLHRSPRRRQDVLLVSISAMAERCLDAAGLLERYGLGTTVVDPRWITPVNPFLPRLAARHRLVVTVEDGCRAGGAGSLIAQACVDAAFPVPVLNLGLPREFIGAGDREELLDEHGLSAERIAGSVLDACGTLFDPDGAVPIGR